MVLLNLAFVAVLYVRSTREAAGPVRELPVIAAVGEFTLTNQLGRTISRADLLGNVWVADIIFTRCPGPCPKMTGQMAQLQTGLAADLPVKFVTLTADPAFDTVAVLKQYGETHRADPARWNFLTGDKRGVYGLAISGLKLGVEERASEQPLPLEDQAI